MTFLPGNWTDSTPAAGVHASAHNDIAVLLNKIAVDLGLTPTGTPAGLHVTHKFPFAFNTPNLLTGATAVFTDGYSPAVGDILHDAWIEIDTAWNGTTPRGDFGVEIANWGSAGLISRFSGGQTCDMTLQDGVMAGLTVGSAPALCLSNASLHQTLVSGPPWAFWRSQGVFVSTQPFQVVVSQDGSVVGADPGATQGAAILYVVTSRPI